MSNKTVEFRKPSSARVDEFVVRGSPETAQAVNQPVVGQAAVAMKQLSVDIPENMHRDLRMECARLGIKNYEVVRKAISRAVDELRGLGKTEGQAWLAG